MMTSTTRTLWLGLALIGLSNAIVLGGVAYNRAGEPTSQVVLTERELGIPYRGSYWNENSGVSLRFRWRVFNSEDTNSNFSHWGEPDWLDADKLAALGFDVSYPLDRDDSDERYGKTQNREVLLVLEYDGAAYQEALKHKQQDVDACQARVLENPDSSELAYKLEQANELLEKEQHTYSRLFAIDAGLDYDALRTQYPDTHRHLITKGQVSLQYLVSNDKGVHLGGNLSGLSVEEVNVPPQQADLLLPYEGSVLDSEARDPRYAVTINYGQRYEPWVEAISEL